MQKSMLFQIAAAVGVNCLQAVTADCQTYHFSAPISGWSEIDLSFGAGSTGGRNMYFGTLDENLYYDPVANTLRQVGTVSINQSNFSFGFSGASGYGTANLNVLGDGTIAFDTGTLPAWGPTSWFWSLPVPVNGTVSYNYHPNDPGQNQLYEGPIAYSFPLELYTKILSAGPEALTISQVDRNEGTGLAAMNAQRFFVGGTQLFTCTSDGAYHYSWQLPATTATVVPESSTLAMLGCGLLGLAFRRRFHR